MVFVEKPTNRNLNRLAMRATVVELLQELIRIPSVNPEGNPGYQPAGEQRCAEFVARFLGQCGAEVATRDVLPNRPNVIGRFPAAGAKKGRIFLAPHLDTVSVAGMRIDPFAAELRDGRVYGRGASDTKGPMAAMLWALHAIKDRIPSLAHEIVFVGLMGEEAGQHGAKAFVSELAASSDFDPDTDFAIIGEPTGLQVVHATKGSCWLRVVATGKSAHAAHPQLGENAIAKMARVVDEIEGPIARALASMTDSLLGHATISTGIIRGGSKLNIVPDRCEAEIDMRTVPGTDTAGVIDRIVAVADGIAVDLIGSAEPLWTEPEHPMVRRLGSFGAHPTVAPWFCDAAWFSSAGIPAVALGPGSIAQAHTDDEWISVESLEAGADFFKRFLESC
jgi:acetylornithine deacetylase/succinyl-diaminopimelate desuccinylase-like protein